VCHVSTLFTRRTRDDATTTDPKIKHKILLVKMVHCIVDVFERIARRVLYIHIENISIQYYYYMIGILHLNQKHFSPYIVLCIIITLKYYIIC